MLHARRFGLLVLGLMVAVPATAAAQFDPWKVEGGRVALHFHEEMLEASGLELQQMLQTDESAAGLVELTELPLACFQVEETSDLLFLVGPDAGFVPYGMLGGTVRALGGFTLASPGTGRAVDFHDFTVHPIPVHNDGPGGGPDPDYFVMSAKGSSDGDFLIRNVKIGFDVDGDYETDPGPGDHIWPMVRIKAWDLTITDVLAAKLQRPELAGRIIGYGKIDGKAQPYDGRWTYPPGQNPFTPYTSGDGSDGAGDSVGPGDATIDVKLGAMGTIQQLGHVGAFPTGRTGMATSTTACNNGDVTVDWLAPMNENHPGIAQQLYRQMGDRFEQVGVAWMKHGFFALANSQCTQCQGGSAQGKFLGLGCSDTYGTSNNGDRFYLGPRSEYNAFTNHWTCTGSYFDGFPVDCVRSEDGSGLNSVDHRLEAFDADLGLPGATYFFEGMYMVQNDVDITNNIGSRSCNMSWNGVSTWIFTIPTLVTNPLVLGPAINRYGDMRTTAGLQPGDGSVILAVKTRDLGGGQWRYEYALFNWNLDRQVRQFSVPAGDGATDFYFHDIDDQAANDWVPVVSGGNVTWTFPDVVLPGIKVAGPLEYGTLYNFGFTSSLPPGNRNAALATQIHGAGGDLLAVATQAPAELNLTASSLAPAISTNFDLIAHGGTDSAMFALIGAGGLPLPQAILLGPVPFTAGQANLTLSLPPEVSNLELLFVAGDVHTSPLNLIALTNTIVVKAQ